MMRRFTFFIASVLTAFLLSSCGSSKENTASRRFYQAFVTRYNVYHNGNEAYKEGLSQQEKGHKDNYMEVIPLYVVSSPTTQKMGSGSFDKAIEKAQKATKLHSIKAKPKRKEGTLSEKDKIWYSKKEYNPFMHNVWMLMANAQFQKGEFLEAATTYAYIIRLFSEEPKIVAEARMRMARCYAELDWNYEADHLFNETARDSIPYKMADEYEAMYASYLLKHERFEEALPHLEKATKRRGRSQKQKAREYYLLGQIYKTQHRDNEAYKAFQKAISLNPPYELEFNARIQQTEVVSGSTAPKMVKTLTRMAKDPNNKDYLDQVYYAIGNIFMAQKDTLQAIRNYEKGAEKSTRNGVEKGILLLHLGNIYWERAKYADAQRCYAEAVGLIDKDSKEYPQLNKRSSILDELVEHTEAIELQDSLQHLATLPMEKIEAIVDSIIKEVIKKEEEEKKKAEEEARNARREEALSNARGRTQMNTPAATSMGDNSWYFYNTQLVSQGKRTFQEKWGRRKLEDNWRRANKSVLADTSFEEYNYDDETTAPSDSLANDTTALQADSLVTDIHEPMYYIQQIPFTEEQMDESNAILQEALFNAGLIYKDKLEDFSLAENTLKRLLRQFPGFSQLDVVYYNLYLMYSRWKRPSEAEKYRSLLLEEYPYSDYSLTLSDPDFEDNALHGKHREDSLYAATYNAYNEGRYSEVHTNAKTSGEKYALGYHRPKFLFLDAMSNLQEGDQTTFLDQLKEIVSKYPENEISELAGLIVQGLQNGRLLTSGSLGTIWQRRLNGGSEGEVADSVVKPFTYEPNTSFIFMLAYEDGTVNDNQLLFEVARYNFTKFMVRNFEISTDKKGGISMLKVSGFLNYNEALSYQRRLYADSEMATRLEGIRVVLISEENLKLLLETHSFDEYQEFYDENFGILPDTYEDDGSLDDIQFDDED
ncbi:MAG: tetratricopeptide repeat protein [Bacteroidaceae bacterium]|nr:tetratricopeptide repeat protein [Bacteroidaceae bacterium]